MGPWSSRKSIRNLEHLFQPGSVAVIGASDRPQSLGATLMRNLLVGGFAGPIWPVNPKHASVVGRPAHADVASLPQPPDLAVICTPAPMVPGLIEAVGRKGTRAAVVLTAGLSATTPNAPGGPSLRQAMLDEAFHATPNRFKGRRPEPHPLPTAVWINPPPPETINPTSPQHCAVNS